ncbi:MAG: hypothetical protein R3F07_02120 [Opitutaceae bacterium]
MTEIQHTRLYLAYLRRRFRHSLARRPKHGTGRFLHEVAGQGARRRCLLVHLTDPFLRRDVDVKHQNRWQARELARLAGEYGFAVDVIDPGCPRMPPTASYDLVIDLHPGLTPAYEQACRPDTRRIAYITGSNPAFSNRAEAGRIAEVERATGVRLKPRRQVPVFTQKDLAACNGFFFIGSRANLETYREFQLPPVHFIRNFAYPVPNIDHTKSSATDFLFLSSGGQVHKGLERLLAVVAGRDDWVLHVCSAFHEEPDFCRLFRSQLFGRRNIIPHGFLPLDSERFRRVAARCCVMVLPSCSEANAGSVLSGVAAGLVPLVTEECGFEPDEVHRLAGADLEAIESGMESVARRSVQWMNAEADRIGALVRRRYSTESYSASVRRGLESVLAESQGSIQFSSTCE